MLSLGNSLSAILSGWAGARQRFITSARLDQHQYPPLIGPDVLIISTRDRGFKSRRLRKGLWASGLSRFEAKFVRSNAVLSSLGERPFCKRQMLGSIPRRGSARAGWYRLSFSKKRSWVKSLAFPIQILSVLIFERAEVKRYRQGSLVLKAPRKRRRRLKSGPSLPKGPRLAKLVRSFDLGRAVVHRLSSVGFNLTQTI
jgi:hypothetical protein